LPSSCRKRAIQNACLKASTLPPEASLSKTFVFLIESETLFASSEILFGFFGEKSELLIAISALLAGLFPAIFKALDLDNNTKQILSSAAEFTNLRDRFRQLGKIKPTETFDELYQSFETLVEKLEDVRRLSPPLPNKHFKSARKSIEAGNYTNEPDIS